jgi:LysM repeat protein
MAYGNRPGNLEGFDYFAVAAIAFLALAAAHVTGAIDGFDFGTPRVDLRAQLASWASGERQQPVAEGFTRRDRNHRVRRGETLSSIAARYGIGLSELVEFSGIEDPAVIEVGDVLRIPPREARLRRSEARAVAEAPASDITLRELLSSLLTGEAPPGQVPASSAGTSAPASMAVAPEVSEDPWTTLDQLLLMAEADLLAARFAEATIAAQAALRFLDENPEAPLVQHRRAEVEIMLATIHIAGGDEEAAHQSFARALEANPALTLDPSDTSPKVLAGLEVARRSSQ